MGLLDRLKGERKTDGKQAQEKPEQQAEGSEGGGGEAKVRVMTVFDIRGVGIIVAGEVLSGAVKVGDTTQVQGRKTEVLSIEVEHKSRTEVVKGEKAGFQLKSMMKGDFRAGDVLTFGHA